MNFEKDILKKLCIIIGCIFSVAIVGYFVFWLTKLLSDSFGYFKNLNNSNEAIRAVFIFSIGTVLGVLLKPKSKKNNEGLDTNESNNWRIRDWVWVTGILVVIIIVLLTKQFGENDKIGGYVSFGSSAVSIALALVAIGYAIYQSLDSSQQNSILRKTLEEIKIEITKVSHAKSQLAVLQSESEEQAQVKLKGIEELIKSVEENKPDKSEDYLKVIDDLKKQIEGFKEEEARRTKRMNDLYNQTLFYKNDTLAKTKKRFELEVNVLNEEFRPVSFMDNFAEVCSNAEISVASKGFTRTKSGTKFLFQFIYDARDGYISDVTMQRVIKQASEGDHSFEVVNYNIYY